MYIYIYNASWFNENSDSFAYGDAFTVTPAIWIWQLPFSQSILGNRAIKILCLVTAFTLHAVSPLYFRESVMGIKIEIILTSDCIQRWMESLCRHPLVCEYPFWSLETVKFHIWMSGWHSGWAMTGLWVQHVSTLLACHTTTTDYYYYRLPQLNFAHNFMDCYSKWN